MARVLVTCLLIVSSAHVVSISHLLWHTYCKAFVSRVFEKWLIPSVLILVLFYSQRRNHPECLSWKCTLSLVQAVYVNGPGTARSFSAYAWITHKIYYQSHSAITALERQDCSTQTPSPAVRISVCLIISSGRWVTQILLIISSHLSMYAHIMHVILNRIFWHYRQSSRW